MMDITFIGTGSGKASLQRHHSSFLISSEKFKLLIDAGDGISKALLQQNINFNSIDGILFSHFHPDHYTGLAALIVQMKMYERNKPLKIFIHHSLKDVIKGFIKNSYLFFNRLGFEADFISFEEKEKVKVSRQIFFTAKQNSHLAGFDEKKYKGQSFSCSSFLFDLSGKKIFYTGDIGRPEDLYLFEEEKIDLMISEITHVELEEILTAYKKIEPQKLFLTHISDEDDKKLEDFFSSLKKNEVKNIIAAVDGKKISI